MTLVGQVIAITCFKLIAGFSAFGRFCGDNNNPLICNSRRHTYRCTSIFQYGKTCHIVWIECSTDDSIHHIERFSASGFMVEIRILISAPLPGAPKIINHLYIKLFPGSTRQYHPTGCRLFSHQVQLLHSKFLNFVCAIPHYCHVVQAYPRGNQLNCKTLTGIIYCQTLNFVAQKTYIQ